MVLVVFSIILTETLLGQMFAMLFNGFFKQKWVLPRINSNVVSLIPKIQGADPIIDYRPIVVVNFKFKIISKILADRLALVAARIISPNQYGLCRVDRFRIALVLLLKLLTCFLKFLHMWLTKF